MTKGKQAKAIRLAMTVEVVGSPTAVNEFAMYLAHTRKDKQLQLVTFKVKEASRLSVEIGDLVDSILLSGPKLTGSFNVADKGDEDDDS